MKHLLVVIFTLVLFVQNSNAQKSKLVGSWLMTKAEVGGEIQKPYFITEFNEDGKLVVMGMEFGTWEYNKKNNSIILKSEMDKDWNGERNIEKLTDKELVTTIDDARLFYKKVDMPAITESNKNSGLMGMWEFKDVPYSEASTLVTFTEPDEFSMIEKQEGMTANLSGTWIFDKNEMSLIMIGLRGEDTFNGENKVVKIEGDGMELENNGKVFRGKRKAQNTSKIERLTFNEDDFYNEDGDYKYYDEEEKLPWRNWDEAEMKMSLQNVTQLVYNYAKLIDNTAAFENKTLTANVQTGTEGFIIIDNIFYGFDRNNTPDDVAFPGNLDYEEPLYPLGEIMFRIVGNEQITTPAGTFNCTVLEVLGDFDVMKKLWMINDKFGVYAKIIEDNPDELWGHYSVYELQEIK